LSITQTRRHEAKLRKGRPGHDAANRRKSNGVTKPGGKPKGHEEAFPKEDLDSDSGSMEAEPTHPKNRPNRGRRASTGRALREKARPGERERREESREGHKRRREEVWKEGRMPANRGLLGGE